MEIRAYIYIEGGENNWKYCFKCATKKIINLFSAKSALSAEKSKSLYTSYLILHTSPFSQFVPRITVSTGGASQHSSQSAIAVGTGDHVSAYQQSLNSPSPPMG